MLKTRFATSVPQPFADESAGFDYFATDFHYMNVAAEIQRQLTARRGFVTLSGPPLPDGKLLLRYLDASIARDATESAQFRANLVRCNEGWTFGDVVIAYSRELGLSPDAGAWSILSQVMQESRKGLMRILILDNAETLDDGGFDELRRFTRVDDPYILPVVLLTGPSFAARLEADLRSLKPVVIASLGLQHLLANEVAAFVRYQVERVGDSAEEAFTPGAVTTIATAAEGDPRVVNRLARQHLDAFSGPRAPVPVRLPEVDLSIAAQLAPAEEKTYTPRAVPAPEPTLRAAPAPEPVRARPSAPVAAAETVVPLARRSQPRPRRTTERLARNLTVGAALLFLGVYGIAFLYSLVPEGPSDSAARPLTVAANAAGAAPAAPPSVPAPARTATAPVVVAEKPAVSAEPPHPAAPQAQAKPGSLKAAAKQVATIEPSAAPPLPPTPAPVARVEPPTRPAAPPAPPQTVARAEPALPSPPPAPPAQTVARAEPAVPPPPQTVARAEPVVPAAPVPPATSPESQARIEPPPAPLPPPTSLTVARAVAPVAPPPVAEVKVPTHAAPPPPAPRQVTVAEPPLAEPKAPPRAAPPPAPQHLAQVAVAEPPPRSGLPSLTERGERLLAAGDIASARQFFERAVEGGDAAASVGLGKTYDPLFLRQVAASGVVGDAAKAAEWYRRAAAAGNAEAATRLSQLMAKYPSGTAGQGSSQ